jgi:hypothetical protein
MDKYIILKKLSNEKVIKTITEKSVWLKIPKGVNTRWIFEAAKDLSQFMKVKIILN